jgi:hypothetical protein
MMKKLLLSLSAFLAASFAFAQSFEVHDVLGNNITGQTIHVWGDSADLLEADVHVLNKSSIVKKGMAARKVNYNNLSGGFNYFCWTICYGPAVDTSLTADNLQPNQTYTNFHGYVNSMSTAGDISITYYFYDSLNVTDKVDVTIVYHLGAVGIGDIAPTGENKLLPAAPNPANSFTNLSYSLRSNVQSGRIVVYNMVGSLIKEIKLDDKQGTVRLNLANMNTGVYFYSLVADDKVITTRKLVVSH